MKYQQKNRNIITIFIFIILLILTSNVAKNVYNSYKNALHANKGVPVTIIMYHSILEDYKMHGEFVISPKQFENDIKYLVDKGYNFITITDLINYVKKAHYKLPENPVIITFDDGYYNNYLYAYPIIKKYNGKIVLSVLGKYTELNKNDEKLSPYYSHVTWSQIKEMKDSNFVEIQNHSYDLHTITKVRSGSKKNEDESLEDYRKVLTNDIMKLQKLLKENSNVKANTFVYPFGKISPEAVDILKELGFEAAVTCIQGINYINKGNTEILFNLKRYNRPHGISTENFFKNKLENTKKRNE